MSRQKYFGSIPVCAVGVWSWLLVGQVSAQTVDPATGALSAQEVSQALLIAAPSATKIATTSEKKITDVKEVNTPALQPYRAKVAVTHSTLNVQELVTTVPAGKRLIIEALTWYGANSGTAQVVFGGLRVGQFGPFVSYLRINPPHASASSALTLQDGVQQGPLYLEADEEVWLSVSKNTADSQPFELSLNGYYIDTP